MRGTFMQQACFIITARCHTPLVSHHLAAHLSSYTPFLSRPHAFLHHNPLLINPCEGVREISTKITNLLPPKSFGLKYVVHPKNLSLAHGKGGEPPRQHASH